MDLKASQSDMFSIARHLFVVIRVFIETNLFLHNCNLKALRDARCFIESYLKKDLETKQNKKKEIRTERLISMRVVSVLPFAKNKFIESNSKYRKSQVKMLCVRPRCLTFFPEI